MPDESDEEEDFTPSIGQLDTISEKPQPEPEPTIITPQEQEQENLRNDIELKEKEIDEFKVSKTASEAEPLKLTDTPSEAVPPPSKKVLSGIPLPDLSLRINTSRQPHFEAQQNLLITDREEPISTKKLRTETRIKLTEQEVEKTKSELEEQKAQKRAEDLETPQLQSEDEEKLINLQLKNYDEELQTKLLDIDRQFRKLNKYDSILQRTPIKQQGQKRNELEQQDPDYFRKIDELQFEEKRLKDEQKQLKRFSSLEEAKEFLSKTKAKSKLPPSDIPQDITELKNKLLEEQKTADEKRFNEIQKELRELEQEKATKIQSAVRGRQQRTSFRTQQEGFNELQALVKGEQARKEFETKKKSKKLASNIVSNVLERERQEKEQQEKQQEIQRKKQEKETKRQELQQQITELERKKEELRNNVLKYEILKDGQRLKPFQANRLKGDFKLTGIYGLLRSQNILLQGDIFILLDELKDTMLKISELNKELRKI